MPRYFEVTQHDASGLPIMQYSVRAGRHRIIADLFLTRAEAVNWIDGRRSHRIQERDWHPDVVAVGVADGAVTVHRQK